MSFGIIVRNSTRSFQRHYNHALGKEIHTREDYVLELKRQGCEPFNPNSVKKVSSKKYVPSKWAREMASEMDRHRDKDGNTTLSTSMIDSIKRHQKGNVKIPKRVDLNDLNPNKGGFSAANC